MKKKKTKKLVLRVLVWVLVAVVCLSFVAGPIIQIISRG